jgi:hypothetical protein
MDVVMKIVDMAVIGCLCCMVSHAEQADTGIRLGCSNRSDVMIELSKLEITDSSLALTYRVRNDSDHDIWVCSEVSSTPFEVFLAKDSRTLLIRKRLDVPSSKIWHRDPSAGTYIRLNAGSSYAESLVIDLPVVPRFVYASSENEEVTTTVRRVVLETGYYDEDLPALVHGIFEVADKWSPQTWGVYPDLVKTYFRGLAVRNALSGFDTLNKDPYGEGHVHIEYSRQALTGEKVLRVEVNGVGVTYSGPVEKEESPQFPLMAER